VSADNTYEGGFDNSADQLSVSPALLDRYLSAAGTIARLAVGIPPSGPVLETYRVPLNLIQDERLSEDLPFGTMGGIAIRHYFPVDGEYRITIKLQGQFNDYLRGMGRAHELEARVDGALIKRFTVGGGAPGRPVPDGFAGIIVTDREWEDYMHHADDLLDVAFAAKGGPRVVTVAFVRETRETEGIEQPRQTSYPLALDQRYFGYPAVDRVTISGPYAVVGPGDTPSRREIFVCRPVDGSDEQSCARKILSKLARRAYRRPVTGLELERLLAFFNNGRREGDFDLGVEFALERLLVDPNFLFRIERDPPNAPPGSVHKLSDLELASRLSFFLWSGIPDDELLDLAIQGRLSDPAELDRQVRRLLADPRARQTLVHNFAAQWLGLRGLRDVLPDPDLFPDFDENLRDDFARETELFVESTLREDRSVLELIAANYTFANERLARHYGIPDVYGNRFRRVTFGSDERRGGLLGQGSILTLTSYANRTSPVLRGKWVLQNILGAAPPSPPANVPPLPERGGGKPVSMREQLEQHRKNAGCATCHGQMDPLGYALENFDAIGAWRTTNEGGAPIDTTATTPDGVHFDGPAGLRATLLSQRERFVETVTQKLLAFALGRGLEYYDRPTIRAIVRETASSDYRWSSIIRQIVQSTTFRLRKSSAERISADPSSSRGTRGLDTMRQ
jgi:hypothetical protein